MILAKILGGVLFAFCIWYILLLYKNNRNKL
jgi:hypothetical protein